MKEYLKKLDCRIHIEMLFGAALSFQKDKLMNSSSKLKLAVDLELGLDIDLLVNPPGSSRLCV